MGFFRDRATRFLFVGHFNGVERNLRHYFNSPTIPIDTE